MKCFRCEHCDDVYQYERIILKGRFVVSEAGILLPRPDNEFEFCSMECLNAWLKNVHLPKIHT